MTDPAMTGVASIALRPMRWWHIEQLLPIEADLFGAEQWSAAMFWNELANEHWYLVALDGQAIAGYAGLASTASTASTTDEAWVQNIAVARTYQRRGLGRRLLEALLAEADRRQARQVLLEVAVDNAAAQKLYARYGFEGVAVRRGYYQPSNTDALVMKRAD